MTPEEMKKLNDTLTALGSAHEELKSTLSTREKDIKSHGTELAGTQEKLAKINTHIDELLAIKDRFAQLEVAVKRGIQTGAPRPEVDEKHLNAFRQYMAKGGDPAAYEGGKFNIKTMTTNSDPNGGFMVPADVSGRLLKKVFETSPMRQAGAAVQNISTDALEGLADISEGGAEWEAETVAATDSTTPTFKKWRIPVFGVGTRPRISQSLLEDSVVDLEAVIQQHSVDKMQRAENTAFVLGNGTSRPRGYLTYTLGVGEQSWGSIEKVKTGSATAITPDSLLALVYALKGAYRANAKFAMHRLTQWAVRTLKDSQNRYLWQPGLEAGQPSSLLGFPVVEMADLDSTLTSGKKPVVFADWNQFYQIVDRAGISVLRDPYTSKPLVELYIRRRVGGDVANFEAGKVLTTET